MKPVTLFHHPRCDRCRRIARAHRFFDWLNRVEVSTADPETGPLRLGEIALLDRGLGRTVKGVAAVRRLFRQIPAYWPVLPLLYLPAVARRIDHQVRGCDGDSCGVPFVPPAVAEVRS